MTPIELAADDEQARADHVAALLQVAQAGRVVRQVKRETREAVAPQRAGDG